MLGELGVGCIAFSPLAQGMLTSRYLDGVPAGLPDGRGLVAVAGAAERAEPRRASAALNAIATGRGQSLAQLALAWALRDPRVTSVLIGASSVRQLEDSLAALDRLDFTADELSDIDVHAVEGGIDLWRKSSTS